MGLYPLKFNNDEIQRLLTQAFRETGYRLDRKDPIIVQYVIQKILLRDFGESQAQLFGEFSERIMPALAAEAKKMEEQKNRLWERSTNAAKEVVDRAGEDFLRRIRDTIRQTDGTLLENLNRHIVSLRNEQRDILTKLDEKHKAFAETAADFKRAIYYAAFGGGALFGILIFVALYFTAR